MSPNAKREKQINATIKKILEVFLLPFLAALLAPLLLEQFPAIRDRLPTTSRLLVISFSTAALLVAMIHKGARSYIRAAFIALKNLKRIESFVNCGEQIQFVVAQCDKLNVPQWRGHPQHLTHFRPQRYKDYGQVLFGSG